MSRADPMHEFVTMDAAEIEADIAAIYTAVTGKQIATGADKLFCQLLTSVALYMNGNNNYAANQNLPSRATGENLDALAEMYYEQTRPAEAYAGVTVEFTITEAQTSAVLIPAETRVSDTSGQTIFRTDEDVYIPAGDTSITVHCTAEEPGTGANGYAIGEINTCIDLFPYFDSCENTTVSDGGSDVPDDDEFYDLLVASQGAYSTAGPEEAYRYFAKRASPDIIDVVINSPLASCVYIYALMSDGTIADSEIKQAILEQCDDKTRRPLTDRVIVADPEEIDYDIALTYYIPKNATASAAAVQAAVTQAVNEYVLWQAGKLGRDINPSKLNQMVMEAGAKRVTVTSPVFTELQDGVLDPQETYTFEETVPQVAKVGTITLTIGGYEDE